MIVICPCGESAWQNERLEARFKEQLQVADFLFRRKLMLAREERRAVDFSVEASEAM